MPFLPLALVTSAVVAPYFVVAALCRRVLSRGCFGFCALATVRGLCVVCACSAPPPNTAVKRDAALKRVAPLLLTLASSNCYAFFASSPYHICVISSLFCSGCAWFALSVQMLFWLVCAGSWHAGFGQVTIHGLRGICFLFSPAA